MNTHTQPASRPRVDLTSQRLRRLALLVVAAGVLAAAPPAERRRQLLQRDGRAAHLSAHTQPTGRDLRLPHGESAAVRPVGVQLSGHRAGRDTARWARDRQRQLLLRHEGVVRDRHVDQRGHVDTDRVRGPAARPGHRWAISAEHERDHRCLAGSRSAVRELRKHGRVEHQPDLRADQRRCALRRDEPVSDHPDRPDLRPADRSPGVGCHPVRRARLRPHDLAGARGRLRVRRHRQHGTGHQCRAQQQPYRRRRLLGR